ncbi:MAG: hypothetical protein JWL88_163 [Parcubacteria group bacterium]|nr:hypothetical protein [Parcubacteria group bacterium]
MKRPSLQNAAAFLITGMALAVPFIVFADDTFTPLTSLPGITKIAATSISLPSFINNLYRIAIGVAAFLAVTQFIQAGFLFMNSADSISANKKAKDKIMNGVIGLVLVLSPYVVFSVINPSILNISLNFSGLQSKNGTGAPVNTDSSGSGVQTATTTSTVQTQGAAACQAFSSISLISKTATCSDSGTGWTSAPATCCEGGDTSFQCCGKPK